MLRVVQFTAPTANSSDVRVTPESIEGMRQLALEQGGCSDRGRPGTSVTLCGGCASTRGASPSGRSGSVERAWGTARATPIENATPAELRALSFAAGSMGPKIEAGCRFVERTGGEAGIGSLADVAAIVRGEAGTHIASAVAASTP